MIYILTQSYPSSTNKYAMSYVHSRNLVYLAQGLNIKVVNMAAVENYEFQGVSVITKKSFEQTLLNQKICEEDIIVSHAPNLKNHFRIINKSYKKFKKVIFIFHGHEVLRTEEYYPSEYEFKKRSILRKLFVVGYSSLKLNVLKSLFEKLAKYNKLKIICVSEWMKNNASKCLNMDFSQYDVEVINNNVNEAFLNNNYCLKNVEADFITIRPLDDSKYAIDLVVQFAKNNPQYSYHIFGKGNYFLYNEKPSNVQVFNDFIKPEELPELLNKYRCALMPTRLDAQGVMVCEMATYGIPVITSDLEVCKEMLSDFENVILVNDEFFSTFDSKVLNEFKNTSISTNTKFSNENTVLKEIQIINNILKT